MGRFAVSSMLFHEYPCEYIFDYVAESGLDGIEFWVETPHFWLRGKPEDELLRCIDNHPAFAPITLHAPTLDLNPTSINPRVAAASIEYTVEAIELAERVGAGVVTIHPGKRTARRVPSAYDYERFERYIGCIRDAAEGKQVRVAIENMEPKVNSLLYTPESAAELLEREPWLYFTLDMGHALMTSVGEAIRYIDLAGERLVNVHVSATKNGRPHYPIHPDENAKMILEALAERGYAGYLTLELQDLHFSHELTSEEKILLLMKEQAVLRDIMA